MEELLKAEDFEGLVTFCEEEELTATNGITTPEIYGTLLALYLLQNELDHAKLLWQRIPKDVKEGNKEIAELWEVGKKLWRREFATVYEIAQSPAWPAHLAPIVVRIVERVRGRVLVLVGQSYSSIRVSELCTLLGQPEHQVRQVVTEKGWEIDTENQIVRPHPPAAPEGVALLEQHERLKRLTDIVSFLEN